MGCFSALKPRKRKTTHGSNLNSNQRPPLNTVQSMGIKLPEPDPISLPSLQSAPPSFINRTKTPPQNKDHKINPRTRTLSAPSSIILDQDYKYTDNNNNNNNNNNNYYYNNNYSNALPLPLPAPEDSVLEPFGNLRNLGSFKGNNVSGPLGLSGPLPLPPLRGTGLRNFSYDELAIACQSFSNCLSEGISTSMYRASFGDDFGGGKKIEATVVRLLNCSQSLKEFINEVNTLAELQHGNLCKLLGSHAQNEERMLVYERLHHGSLERLFHGRSEGGGPAMDWSTRMKVALGAAKGLAFLHEEGPFQAMYNEFSAANIQIDKDFTAKLSGYGCVSHNINTDLSNTSSATANLSVETLEKGVLTPKSNVYSFGIILLELITGRKNLDSRHPKEERNLVKWSKPFLTDDCRLSLILDPRIKGRFPSKAARITADIIVKCLQKEPKERPTMRGIVEVLEEVCEIKCLGRYPLREPGKVGEKVMGKLPSFSGKVMGKSPSFGGVVGVAPLPPPRSCVSMVGYG